jgi:hypothetical protein
MLPISSVSNPIARPSYRDNAVPGDERILAHVIKLSGEWHHEYGQTAGQHDVFRCGQDVGEIWIVLSYHDQIHRAAAARDIESRIATFQMPVAVQTGVGQPVQKLLSGRLRGSLQFCKPGRDCDSPGTVVRWHQRCR